MTDALDPKKFADAMAADQKPAAHTPTTVSFSDAADVLTFDGYKISGELLRMLTATPCGIMFRIIERKDGVVSISEEYDRLAIAAPDMLAALKTFDDYLNDNNHQRLGKIKSQVRAAIAKAKGGEK